MKDFVYLFPFLFAGMFVLIVFILSKKGWTGLASRYQYMDIFTGERVGIISAAINGVNYGNCLLLQYNRDGIYLRPVFIFRLFHPPVLIPWKEIKTVRDKKMLLVTVKELVVGDPAIAFIQMKPATVEKLVFLKKG